MGPAHLNKVVGPDDGEGEVRVHGLVRLGDGLVRDRELVDLHVVVQQLRHHLLLRTSLVALVSLVVLAGMVSIRCPQGEPGHHGKSS